MAAAQVIGVLSPLVTGAYFGGLLDGIAQGAAAAGYVTVAFQSLPAGVTEEVYVDPWSVIRPVGWRHIDGFISVVRAASDASLTSIVEAGKPLVLVSHHLSTVACPVVAPDNAGGIRAAVTHLLAHGHRKIAFAGMLDLPDIRERYETYCQVLREHDLGPDAALLYEIGDTVQAGGREAAKSMLRAGLPSTALMASTDENAIGVLEGLRAAGVRLPSQQAVVGFDDRDSARHSRPTLSTVSADVTGIGKMAADLVIRAVRGEPVAAGSYHFPTTFVARQSCGCSGASLNGLTRAAAPDTGELLVVRPLAAALAALDPAANPSREARLAEFGQRVAAALASAESTADHQLRGIGEELWPATSRLDSLELVTGLLRQGATECYRATRGAEPAHGRLEQVLAELTLGLAVAAGREEFDRSSRLQDALSTQYEVSMELLRGHRQNPAALHWLAKTKATAGALGMRAKNGRDGSMTIKGMYDPNGDADTLLDQQLDEEDFPPEVVLQRAASRPGDVVVVIPVTTGDGGEGLLAVLDSVDRRGGTGRETFNQWAALLGVALDHQEVVEALRDQRASLASSLSREQDLAESIRTSEQRYAFAAAAANDGLWDWNLRDSSMYYSDRALSILGVDDPPSDGSLTAWLSRVHPDDRAELLGVLERQKNGYPEALECEHRIQVDEHTQRWVLSRSLAVVEGSAVTRIVGSLTDVTVRRQLEDRLRQQALFDNLTGLPNRVVLLDRLGVALRRCERQPDRRFAVLFLDLDGFKPVNDTLGHSAGDKLLVGVAHRLQSFVRSGDTAARLGGDEFVILLDDLSPSANVAAITERLQDVVAEPFDIDGTVVRVTASIGISSTDDVHIDAEDMLRAADISMYRSKRHKLGGPMLDTARRDTAVRRTSTEAELRAAVHARAFVLHYQPIVELGSGRVSGFEALIRWPHPDRGLVPPGEFLPVAQEAGLMIPIGRWVIEEACRQSTLWRLQNSAAGGLPISVNVSDQEFWDRGLCAHIDSCLAETGEQQSAIVVEITENVVMRDAARGADLLRRLQDRGIPVHVDDFGTGHSSLNALRQLPIDALKIDRSFVFAMRESERTAGLVEAIVAMARSLQLDVIAEGIETPEQRQALADHGCRYGQGYFFSRPRPAADVDELFPG